MHAQTQLTALADLLTRLRRDPGQVNTFTAHARQQSTALLAALPERYATVLHDLLDRLDSSVLFAEESCSFSQHDLLDSLQLWIDKAGQQLAA